MERHWSWLRVRSRLVKAGSSVVARRAMSGKIDSAMACGAAKESLRSLLP